MQPELIQPSSLNETDLSRCVELVAKGGAVSRDDATRGFKKAQLIGLFRGSKLVIAVGALKNPYPNYQKGVFKKAQASEKFDDYQFELGYFATDPEFQGQKLAKHILSAIVSTFNDSPMFATTGSAPMEHLLSEKGFRRDGLPYPPSVGHAELSLLIRKPTF
jgi:GNAT superfamily N-acetyltransferase